MSQTSKPIVPSPNAPAQALRTLRLVWRLLLDTRVSTIVKLVPAAALVYVLSPIDVLPDFILGLGQLDDLGVILLGLTLFVELCPKQVVAEHRRLLDNAGRPTAQDENVIDGSYRVVSDDDPSSHQPYER